MGILVDDHDIESGIEHALSGASSEVESPVEERLRTFHENNERLEKAITENDIETIESLNLQVEAYREEGETVLQEISEIDIIIEKERDSKVSSAVLTNEKMRLSRWLEKVTVFITRYEAYIEGTVLPENTEQGSVANLLSLWDKRVDENIATLQDAIATHDSEAIELLGNSLESYKQQEADFEKAISDITLKLRDERVSDGVRAILSNDQVYLLDLLDDIRFFISEYTHVLHEQVRSEIENI